MLVIFILFFIQIRGEIGPLDNLVKNSIEVAKDWVERVLVEVRVPKIIQNPQTNVISFQLDQSENVPTPECKECRIFASEALIGTWHVVLWSHNLLVTVIADLDGQIDKLEANQPLTDQKTLFDWLSDPPGLVCPQLTVVSADETTKFEFAYTVHPGGKHKSIVNKWIRQPDASIEWHLTPRLKLHVCPTLVETDVVIVRQIDSFPRCDNVIVLLRGDLSTPRIDSIRDYLESEHRVLATNPLRKTRCPDHF